MYLRKEYRNEEFKEAIDIFNMVINNEEEYQNESLDKILEILLSSSKCKMKCDMYEDAIYDCNKAIDIIIKDLGFHHDITSSSSSDITSSSDIHKRINLIFSSFVLKKYYEKLLI